jgi:hypothetical protein
LTCPQALEKQLREKAECCERAGWWVRWPTVMACPLLCLEKKDGSLRTVIDARNRNANTILDVMPMPDMRSIMDSLARNTSIQDRYDRCLWANLCGTRLCSTHCICYTLGDVRFQHTPTRGL